MNQSALHVSGYTRFLFIMESNYKRQFHQKCMTTTSSTKRRNLLWNVDLFGGVEYKYNELKFGPIAVVISLFVMKNNWSCYHF